MGFVFDALKKAAPAPAQSANPRQAEGAPRPSDAAPIPLNAPPAAPPPQASKPADQVFPKIHQAPPAAPSEPSKGARTDDAANRPSNAPLFSIQSSDPGETEDPAFDQPIGAIGPSFTIENSQDSGDFEQSDDANEVDSESTEFADEPAAPAASGAKLRIKPAPGSDAAPKPSLMDRIRPMLKLASQALGHHGQDPADAPMAPEPEQEAIPLPGAEPPAEMDDRLVSVTHPSSIMAEEYRGIRTRLLARYQNARHLVHTITSATPKEGKTLTSLNLGFSFAELIDRRTVVIEGDLRMPMFQKMLFLPDAPGLIQVLRGEARVEDVIRQIPGTRLSVISAGGRTADDAIQLLSGTRMGGVLQTLRARFDHVIVDTPPALELADAGILGSMSDDVMLIARMHRTPRYMIDQTLRVLKSYNAPVSGVVLTDMKLDVPSYVYRYSYRNGYGRYGSYTPTSRQRKSA